MRKTKEMGRSEYERTSLKRRHKSLLMEAGKLQENEPHDKSKGRSNWVKREANSWKKGMKKGKNIGFRGNGKKKKTYIPILSSFSFSFTRIFFAVPDQLQHRAIRVVKSCSGACERLQCLHLRQENRIT